MVTLLYAADSVGPVCERVVRAGDGGITAVRDTAAPTYSDVLIRWGSRAANHTGELVINTPTAVTIAKNKLRSRRILETLAPTTWAHLDRAWITYPCVVRPKTHHAGKKFFVCRNERELRAATTTCGKGWYAAELIEKESEYRVFVLHGYVVCVSQRFPANADDVAWNLARGGRLINLRYGDWPVEVLRTTITATKRLGLDWAAMDVCRATDGRTVVFEANTAPGLRNPHTLRQIAKAFESTAGRQVFTLQQEGARTWKDLLHPALATRT